MKLKHLSIAIIAASLPMTGVFAAAILAVRAVSIKVSTVDCCIPIILTPEVPYIILGLLMGLEEF